MVSDRYSPQLDSLRAIAVGGVFYSHLWEENSNAGHLGVRLFFVLSGFLITRILLGIRDSAPAAAPHARSLLHFYIRRALRTWPAFYALLGLAVATDFAHIRDTALWHALFASNILFSFDPRTPGAEVIWWSLAVEEQFFLLWPALILFLPRNLLPWAVSAVVATGLGYHLAMNVLGITGYVADFFTPASFDALGAGAMLAVANHRGWVLPRLGWAAVAAVATLIVIVVGPDGWVPESLGALPMVALVSAAAEGFKGPVGRGLEWPPLRYIGKISYGLYLYHAFVFAVLMRLHLPGLFDRGPLMFAVAGSLSVVVATGSWFLMERPISRLKRLFPYPASQHARLCARIL